MDINLTAVLMLIGFVIPGLWAQRSRHLLAPKTLDKVGATEELAHFAGDGLLIHLFLVTACLLFFSHWKRKVGCDLAADFSSHHLGKLVLNHYWFVLAYLAASLFTGHIFGMIGGLLAIRQPFRRRMSRWLKKARISLMIERPIVFDVFYRKDFSGITFLELEMKQDGGFYTGQLAEYALVCDEEPHKPVYLEKVLYRPNSSGQYSPLQADGVWFDLADALSVRIVRKSDEELLNLQKG